MRLKKVTLNNFRCFDSLELDLHPRLTVLVAENGGGKTAILDGIAFGLASVLSHLSSANQRLSVSPEKDTDLRLVPRTDRRGRQYWGPSDFTQVIIETTSNLKWDRLQILKKGKQPDNIIGQTELITYTSRIFDSLQGGGHDLLPVFAYYDVLRGHLRDRASSPKTKVNFEYPTSSLVGALESLTDFSETLQWFDQKEAAEFRANAGCPRDAWDESPALNAVRNTVSATLGGMYHNPHFNSKGQFLVESTATPGMLLQVEQLSRGYQSMLALGMGFARRLALANDHLNQNDIMPIVEEYKDWIHPKFVTGKSSEVWASPPLFAPAIMLVDEIDLHLHPSWQQRVLDDLMRAFPLTQFIVTTHSPQVLSAVTSDCVRILLQEVDPETGHTTTTVRKVEWQTRGVASSDLLARIMGVDPVPRVPEAQWLVDYQALIQQNLHQEQDGLALRTKLEAHFSPQHPVMRECDRMIRLQGFKQRLPRELGKGEH